MKIGKLIEKLEKLKEKHGEDMDVAGRYIHGSRFKYEPADKVNLRVKSPKTKPMVYVEAYFE